MSNTPKALRTVSSITAPLLLSIINPHPLTDGRGLPKGTENRGTAWLWLGEEEVAKQSEGGLEWEGGKETACPPCSGLCSRRHPTTSPSLAMGNSTDPPQQTPALMGEKEHTNKHVTYWGQLLGK